MIDQLGEPAPGRNITLRINPGFGHGHSQKTNTGGEQSKHGIWFQELDECLVTADHYGLGVTGLHMHIGSGTDLEHLAQVCCRDGKGGVGRRPIDYLDQRGRRPADSLSPQRYARRICVGTLSCGMRRGSGWSRRLATRCRWRSSRVDTCRPKRLPGCRDPRRQANRRTRFLSAGCRVQQPGSSDPVRRLSSDDAGAARRGPSGAICWTWWSAARCASRATSSRKRKVDSSRRASCRAAAVGDWLVLECAGAYGFVMSSNYNSKPMAAEVLVRQGTPHLVRKRQTFAELTQNECIPE